MPWTYKEFSNNDGSSSASNVISEMLATLNSLPPAQAATAKTGITDQHHGPSFGVVFYNTSIKGSNLPPYALTGAWTEYTKTISHNSEYPTGLQAICDMLNGDGEAGLSESQAAFAHFSMADYESGWCHMALFYQEIG
ncbi:hypothetical protein [Haliangium ochraceum]|uniref:Uncharacterized protein n=1 Tax=Haliangium ochraceum (strain DSM 14365 / JCM 11303 / SMP-2) TaxID=502025 RepID=D0LMQ3_HALO1|nr:hypothetical protein [Haliangium ochraceum]ACY18740.1 hypothetical protein Hoch_6269 [Haliangium ochraceum DSM 14365]